MKNFEALTNAYFYLVSANRNYPVENCQFGLKGLVVLQLLLKIEFG